MRAGGTPNLSNHVRSIPSATFCAPWFNPSAATNARLRSLPHPVFKSLSARGQEVAKGLAAEDGDHDVLFWEPDWDTATMVGGGGDFAAAYKGQTVARL